MVKRKRHSQAEHQEDLRCGKLLSDGLSRKSKRCHHITSVGHGNIRDWLLQVLHVLQDDWKVHVPSTYDHSPSAHWPSEDNFQEVVNCLASLTTPAPQKLDPTDMLEGSCEQLAIQLSQAVASQMQEPNVAIDQLADSAQCLVKNQLTALGAADAVSQVFGHQSRMHWDQGPLLWQSMFNDQFRTCTLSKLTVSKVDTRTLDFLCGTTHAAEHIKVAASQHGPPIRVLPLYLLSYIFADEEIISSSILKKNVVETAQYSVHCVGLVFDTASHNIVVCVSNSTTDRSRSYC